MSTDPSRLSAEPFAKVGALIQRHASVIIDRWSQRASEHMNGAMRLHHDALLDHLPLLLWELGRSLAQAGGGHTDSPLARPAKAHGVQRWEVGWSPAEMVRDYQLLRLVLIEFLEENLGRPVRHREVMAIGLWMDEAIASSVDSYVEVAALPSLESRVRSAQEPAVADFIAFLAHELRNPLAPLGNAHQVLPHVISDSERFAWTHALMGRQLGLLSRLVDDLLDVSRVTQGKLTLRRETTDLATLLRDTAQDCQTGFLKAGLKLSVEIPDAPVWVKADSTRLVQILGNLLANAQKFSDPGGEVGVSLVPDSVRQRAVVTVRDTGIGIEPSMLPRIFEAYAQAERSVARSRGGLGLGLALVKGLLEAHGGGIEAASEGVGTGTRMTFWLPLTGQPMAEMPEKKAGKSSRPRRILVIEDNLDTAESFRMLLELHGHQVETCDRGPAGVELARTWSPDVILCDLGLPGMDGFAVARALRADPATAFARLICLSGYGQEDKKKAARDAGFDEILVKPVEIQKLILALAPG